MLILKSLAKCPNITVLNFGIASVRSRWESYKGY